ncbi:MAG: hypothetical protein FJ265_17555 [Planctomycetes bacterium]|nr:hypothetical protein [Planctomycetota bacterium]
MRHLAVDAPIAELVQHRLIFLVRIGDSYRKDPVMWRGVARLCDTALADPSIPDRRIFGKLLAQIIVYGEPEFAQPLAHLVPELRRLL